MQISSSKRILGRETIRFDSSVSGSGSSRGTESDDGDYSVLLKEVRAKCLQLKKYASVQKFELEDEPFNTLNYVTAIFSRSYENEELYSKLHEIAVDTFSDVPGNVVPGTVAAFFIGCTQNTKYDGNMLCSAQCAGNIPLPKNSLTEFCGTHVATFSNGVLEHVFQPVNKHSDILLIHVMNSSIELSNEDITELRRKGIKEVILSHMKDGKYVSRSDKMKLEVLETAYVKKPTKVGKSKKATEQTSDLECGPKSENGKRKHKKEEKGFGWGVYLIIFFILLLFIIAFVYVFFMRANGDGSNHSSLNNHGHNPVTSQPRTSGLN